MASTTLAPADYSTAALEDPVSYEEAALLFKETGYPQFQERLDVIVRKLARWAKQDDMQMEWRGRKAVVSFSDLLEAYARRFPAPGRS